MYAFLVFIVVLTELKLTDLVQFMIFIFIMVVNGNVDYKIQFRYILISKECILAITKLKNINLMKKIHIS
jgi:hypothetical protein